MLKEYGKRRSYIVSLMHNRVKPPNMIIENKNRILSSTIKKIITDEIKDYAEIHPKFLEQFKDDLGDSWNLLDSSGNSHTVVFNGDYAYPLLIEGWSRLSEFYNFEGRKQIFLNYLGRDYRNVIP
ncbi:hypothetical protein MTR_4g053550 [Medicago truncatula]|uniref:Uncharacterized protein n=1 Tax=Medicago truncatula TaxID=3880 RepID=G7JIG8_MEDTR|nr:hypothetical protein MTR_4g053550 [Medicago truncatula]